MQKIKAEDVRAITIISKVWFDKDGYSYHTNAILVNGVCVHHSELIGGDYGNWEHHAFIWLIANMYIVGMNGHMRISELPTFWRWCSDHDIVRYATQIEVRNKRDLY